MPVPGGQPPASVARHSGIPIPEAVGEQSAVPVAAPPRRPGGRRPGRPDRSEQPDGRPRDEAAYWPARVLILNGVGAAVGPVADLLRTSWQVAVVSADAVDLLVANAAVGAGRPVRADLRCRVLAQVASSLAHACPPMVVVAATIADYAELRAVSDDLRSRGVDVAHVVVRVSEADLHSWAHGEGGAPDARRRWLQQARRVALEVDTLAADGRVALSGSRPEGVLRDVARALHRRGWLDRTGAWVPARPHSMHRSGAGLGATR